MLFTETVAAETLELLKLLMQKSYLQDFIKINGSAL